MNWFEKLKLSLILVSIKGDLRQPQNYAMGRVPKGHSHWNIAQQYIYDIERIIRELRAAASFVSSLPEEAFLKDHSISREDYIMYHQGYFLDLTHQLKDKLCQMVGAIATPRKDYLKKKIENKTTLRGLLKSPNVEKIPKLLNLLREWDDNTQNGVIAKALKKRTHYHHYKNPLPKVESYMRASSFKSMLDPKFESHLSEYGKKKLAEKMEENVQLWQTDGSNKMKDTLGAIEKNVDEVARVTINYFRFPTLKKGAELINEYLKLDDLVRAKRSSYSLSSISSANRFIIGLADKILTKIFKENLRAVYLTGSIFRDDFIPGVSNLNVIVIMRENNKKEELLAKLVLDILSKNANIFLESKILPEEKFMAPSSEKIRFFCLTDGMLILGEDLLKKEKTPKVCFNLAWLLNKDFKDYVAKIKEKLKDKALALSDNQLSSIARELMKRTYRLSFSMVMGNQVIYTPSFKKMRELQNFYYPSNKRLNDNLYKLLKKGIRADREALLEVIQSYEKKIMKLYDTMETYCDKDNPHLDTD